MSEITCAAYDCKYNSNKNVCTAKSITLGWENCLTFWDGRQEFWKCKMYERSEESKRLERMFIECMRRDGVNTDD